MADDIPKPEGPGDAGERYLRSIAAVDLGSNSFHLVVAREEDGQVRVLDRDRVRVALRSGLLADGTLDPKVAEFALSTLRRFAQRVQSIPDHRIRAVGTQTFRRLKDGGMFLDSAERALGHSIALLSGTEEARLIYRGVSRERPGDDGQTLVVDIGGGSTEFVIGVGSEPKETASLPMGCVSYQHQFFKGGHLGRRRFARAEVAAEAELRGMQRRFRQIGWDTAIGTSGTAKAISDVIHAEAGDGTITLSALERLRDKVIAAGSSDELAQIPGMPIGRAPVFASGLAILIATVRRLKVERMTVSRAALREGVLYDLLGRGHSDDARERTVTSLMRRYGVDNAQAIRVRDATLYLLDSVSKTWNLNRGRAERYLDHAARLHEIGLSVAFSGYHKHGGYLIAHGDLPGFSREEQTLLSTLVRWHRRKITPDFADALSSREHRFALRLIYLLRIAVLINRGRNPDPAPLPEVRATEDSLSLAFPSSYLDNSPMTRLDLKAERSALQKLGLRLRFA